ncbi:uncharacterized protein J3R85_013021, partial [Psidium guajava]
IATVFTVILFLLLNTFGSSTARELRPADHGLEYRSSPPEGVNPSPDMMSFFGTSASASASPPSSSHASPADTALTRPMESSSSWGLHRSGDGSGGGGGRDHVLLVASIACGAAGVVLLGASAFIFLFLIRRERARPVPQSTSQQEK